MAKYTGSWSDSTGAASKNVFYAPNDLNAIAAMQAATNMSNAQVTGIYRAEPISLAGVPDNNAIEANMESVRAKLRVTYEGDDAAPGAGNPKPQVSLYFPAPIGGDYDGSVFDIANNPTYAYFVDKLYSASGVQMKRIVSAGYTTR